MSIRVPSGAEALRMITVTRELSFLVAHFAGRVRFEEELRKRHEEEMRRIQEQDERIMIAEKEAQETRMNEKKAIRWTVVL